MAAVEIAWQFDQDKLNAAIAERVKYQGRTVRTFAQIVNTALYSVALKAQQYTPKADQGKIDASLNVTVNTVINKMGKEVPGRKGKKFKYGARPGEDTPLAFLLVLARANINAPFGDKSLYNLRTNYRWELDKAALKGGRAHIRAMAERMISARHSSGSLLKAGWKPAMDILRPFIARNDLGGARQQVLGGTNKDVGRLGTAIPAVEGWYCWGMIQNNVGLHGGKLAELQQEALLQWGTVPLQMALSEEADKMYARIKEWQERDAARFNAQVG